MKEKFNAIYKKDKSYDNKFVYAVKTTGIYCRPSCSSRPAKPENILFFDNSQDAEENGFRACLKCKPNDLSLDETQNCLILKAISFLEQNNNASLKELSQYLEYSEFYIQRLFKKIMGLSPKKYSQLLKKKNIELNLRKNNTITQAIYKSGYNSTNQFYSVTPLGMSAKEYKNNGKNLSMEYITTMTSFGYALIAQSKKGISYIALGNNEDELITEFKTQFNQAVITHSSADKLLWIKEVVQMIECPSNKVNPTIPLDIQGTVFQKKVWDALKNIPFGKTKTYKEIACNIGHPTSARAVANACASNKIAILIPCHRVIRENGELSGYRWGIERKKALLKKENSGNN